MHHEETCAFAHGADFCLFLKPRWEALSNVCGAGHNLRLILAALRLCCARLGLSVLAVIAVLIAAPVEKQPAFG